MINVLKIFDLVMVLAPESVQPEASVIGLEMYHASFTQLNTGLGSALAVLLFALVLPGMAWRARVRNGRKRGGVNCYDIVSTRVPELKPAGNAPVGPPRPSGHSAGPPAVGVVAQTVVLTMTAIWLFPTLGLAVASLRSPADNSATGGGRCCASRISSPWTTMWRC